tara:strand:- start:1811 stop:2323 length:513 start_codon:yes stop_codon:yes gene_type:complete
LNGNRINPLSSENQFKIITMKNLVLILVLLVTAFNVQSQNMSYYWAEMVPSIEGSRSYEQRGSPDLFPITAYFEIDSNSLKNDSISIKIHFISFTDSSSLFFITTLGLFSKYPLNDKRRDVYLVDKYVMELDSIPMDSNWIKVHRSGGLMITQVTACNTSRNVGVFPVIE